MIPKARLLALVTRMKKGSGQFVERLKIKDRLSMVLKDENGNIKKGD